MPQDWIINANAASKCLEGFRNNANLKLGLCRTFDKTAILFVLMGMVFGWPHSLNYFSAL